jgi:O-antigen/teichoic acid export membrane protein
MNLRGVLRTEWWRGAAASPFIRQVSETYLTRILIVALGFVNSVLVTRILGPEGRGLFAVATTVAAIGVQLGNLGLHSSNTYQVSREPRTLPLLLGNSLLVSAVAAWIALLAFPVLQWRPTLAPVTGLLLPLTLVAIPAGLASLLLQNLLIGTLQIRTYNVIDLTTRVLAIVLIAGTIPLGLVSPEMVFALVQITVVLGVAWAFFAIRRGFDQPVGGSLELLRRGMQYGLRAYLGSLFAFLVLRSDVVLVNYLRGAKETGYYSIAVGLADILLMLPTVVGTVLFPRLSAAADLQQRWQLTRRVLKVMLPAVPLALLAALVAAPFLIRLAYGSAFDPSFPAVAWLLPGVGFFAINTILMNLFAACGMPPISMLSPLVALVVNVLLNLLLVPAWGFVAASVSSSICYGLMLAMSIWYTRFRLLRPRHA